MGLPAQASSCTSPTCTSGRMAASPRRSSSGTSAPAAGVWWQGVPPARAAPQPRGGERVFTICNGQVACPASGRVSNMHSSAYNRYRSHLTPPDHRSSRPWRPPRRPDPPRPSLAARATSSHRCGCVRHSFFRTFLGHQLTGHGLAPYRTTRAGRTTSVRPQVATVVAPMTGEPASLSQGLFWRMTAPLLARHI